MNLLNKTILFGLLIAKELLLYGYSSTIYLKALPVSTAFRTTHRTHVQQNKITYESTVVGGWPKRSHRLSTLVASYRLYPVSQAGSAIVLQVVSDCVGYHPFLRP